MLGSAAVLVFLALGQAPAALPLDRDWTTKTLGDWRVRHDHRDLLVMRHAWTPSNKGDFASATREVAVPAEWSGPVTLAFYCSDDYHTDNWRPDGSWLSAEGFVGQRFKQVLVGDKVVWSQDVADPVDRDKGTRVSVPLPVKPGEKFLLTLLAYDAVDSKTSLEQDFYQSPNGEKKRDEDPDAVKFMTCLYWGDLHICNRDIQPDVGRRPAEKAVQAVHVRRWPIPVWSEKPTGPVTLEVSARELPKQGFPASCGVPVGAGVLPDSGKLGLTADGKALYAQRETLATWLDGSAQWVLLDFPVTPGMSKLGMAFGGSGVAGLPGAKLKEDEVGVRVAGNPIAYAATRDGGVADVKWNGKPWMKSVGLSLESGGNTVSGSVESVAVETKGPFRTTVATKGTYAGLGSYALSISTYTGMPYVFLRHRYYNDTDKPVAVAGMEVAISLAEPPEAFHSESSVTGTALAVLQSSQNERTANGAAADAAEPAWLAWKGGCVTARQFRELFPKALRGDGASVTVDLVAAGNSPVTFTPGECKSHEIWLAAGDVDPATFADAVAHPPLVQNAEYFCATGAFGLAATHAVAPVLREYMKAQFKEKDWGAFGQQYGVRDFPDAAYYGGLPKWCNNYYERMLGLWSEWAMSGDRAWHDRAGDVCRHILDVAVIHSDVPGKDWRGALHGPGDNHVPGPWYPNLRVAGLDLYYKLTGDTAARDAVLDAGAWVARVKPAIDHPSVRDHAGPFDTVCTAYALTGDPNLLDVGAEYVRSAARLVEMRRGVWAETHGSMVYRGNVPWMVAQEARPLYLWYRLTGDVLAAQVLVGLAESIVCENTDWDKPGEVSGYSHNPHYAMTPAYDLIITPVIFAAYELTGDKFFLDAAKAQWDRAIREKKFDSPLNCYWNTPWLMYYLKLYGS